VREDDTELAQLREITDELARAEFTGAARSGRAKALVDGQGTLLDLWISDDVLGVRTLDLDALNADIVEAVTAGRVRAAAYASRRLHPVFPALFADPDGTC
jgi:DNA-binding protein YbaB